MMRWWYTLKDLKARQWLYLFWFPFYWYLDRLWCKCTQHHSISTVRRHSDATFSVPDLTYNAADRWIKDSASIQILHQIIPWHSHFDWHQYTSTDLTRHFHLHYWQWMPLAQTTEALAIAHHYIKNAKATFGYHHPYCISLRLRVAIKLWITHPQDELLLHFLHQQYQFLRRHKEYHLDGNHLLENLISLSIFETVFEKHTTSPHLTELIKELNCQFLDDGGHIEQSITYQRQLLGGLLELAHYLKAQNNCPNALNTAIENALSWLQVLVNADGSHPHIGDSTDSMGPHWFHIRTLATALGYKVNPQHTLGASKYRIFSLNQYRIVVNFGTILAKYQAGHYHNDALALTLNIGNDYVIVDAGIPHYQIELSKKNSRSTYKHNTLIVDNCEQNDIWKRFRVGRKAHFERLLDEEDTIKGCIKYKDVEHERMFKCQFNNLIIEDKWQASQTAYVQFLVTKQPEIVDKTVKVGSLTLEFSEGTVDVERCSYYKQWEKPEEGFLIKIKNLKKQLITSIEFGAC